MPGISGNSRPSSSPSPERGPPPLKRRCSDKLVTKAFIKGLQEKRKENIGIDMHFVFEGGKIGAHKLVLMSLSNKFETLLNSGAGLSEILLQLPGQGSITFTVAEAFVQALYCEDIFQNLAFNDAMMVALLAQQYEIDALVKRCVKILAEKVTEDNCVGILLGSDLDSDAFIPLMDAAENCLKGSVHKLIEKSSHTWTKALWDKVLSFEWKNPCGIDYSSTYFEYIKESVLFTNLHRWRQLDDQRDTDFRDLLKKIRFTLMTDQEITSIVEPANVLSAFKLERIRSFLKGNGDNLTTFICRSRCYNLAETEEILFKLIKTAKSSEYIRLPEGTFKCLLHFPQTPLKNVTIKGAGIGKTKLICLPIGETNFHAWLGNSTICDLTISSENPTYLPTTFQGETILIKNIAFENTSVVLTGFEFRVDNVSVTFPPGQAELTSLSGNVTYSYFSNVSFCNSKCGIFISCASILNTWSNLSFVNVLTGITIEEGFGNKMENIRYKNEAPVKERRAIVILAGQQNEVTNVTCEFKELMSDSFAIYVRGLLNKEVSPATTKSSKDNIFKAIRNGNILLSGRDNRVEDFETENGFIADSSVGTVLVNCKMEKLLVKGTTEPELQMCSCKRIVHLPA